MAAQAYKTASGRSIEESGLRYGEAAFQKLGAALYAEGQDILKDALPLVPVDTGALRGSGYVTEPMREGNRLTVEIGFGGPAAQINPKTLESTGQYALYVHENLEAHHDVGQAKYLQVPFDEHTAGMAGRLAERMNRATEGAEDNSGGGGAPE